MLDLLASAATGGKADWQEFYDEATWHFSARGRRGLNSLLSGEHRIWPIDSEALGELSRYLLLAASDYELRIFGFELLANAVGQLPKNLKTRTLRMTLVQAAILLGKSEDAKAWMGRWKDIRQIEHGYLESEELYHSHLQLLGEEASVEPPARWLQQFNRSFTEDGFAPVTLMERDAEPFDRLDCVIPFTGAFEAEDTNDPPVNPKVSVVLTTFRPSRNEIFTSVTSILKQTVHNLEVLVIDDCSGQEWDDLFSEIEGLDSRVRVERMQRNGGTYVARNRGFSLAKGEFVTGQDDDDWSHPQRLEMQIKQLQSNPDAIACRVSAIFCLPSLSRLRLGYKPVNSNASSLMTRNLDMRKAGGFLHARKAADTELARRLERISSKKVVDLPLRLSVVRVEPHSLSRQEFAPGWSHPSRNMFKSSYLTWHGDATPEALERGEKASEVYVPQRFRIDDENQYRKFDVVIAGDWRKYGGPQKSMIEEIWALKENGFSVAVLHLEAVRFMTKRVEPLNPHIQRMINRGEVEQVLYDDLNEVGLLILRYPPILQFAPDEPTSLKVDTMLITANQAPSELDGTDVRYIVEDCTLNAQRMFKCPAKWLPQGPQVREAITPYLNPDELTDFDSPGILDPDAWMTSIPRSPRRDVPVVGRHSRDDPMKWPEVPGVLQQVYATDGSMVVRVMGGGKTPLRTLGLSEAPAGWEILEKDELPVREFLDSLDFFVFFQNSQAIEAFGRSILEAIAANLVVILPPHYEPVFGEAAVYCDADEIESVVNELYYNWPKYIEQQNRAEKILRERFTRQSFASMVTEQLGTKED
ncbi:glycosyltransferase [Corynebacterium confusum]